MRLQLSHVRISGQVDKQLFKWIMAAKQTLVTFQERKKIINIPQGNGIDYLRKEFCRIFGIESKAAPVTFQRFNLDFQEYVDIDSDSEIFDKEKLQAVVSFAT